MQKQVAILGSTGSIGTQTLEVIEKYPDTDAAKVAADLLKNGKEPSKP